MGSSRDDNAIFSQAITPTKHELPLKTDGFRNLAEVLDYASQGDTGCNFYGGRGELKVVLSYRELCADARLLARHLHGMGLERGARLALVADTHPDFLRMFFACQYAGLVPVPLPAAVHLGGREAFVQHLRAMLVDCGARAAFASGDFLGFLDEASEGLDLRCHGTLAEFLALPAAGDLPPPAAPEELAYLQYTSGSTRFPRGTMITQRAVLTNLAGILQNGIQVRRGDRYASWLPFYHDMGLVGLVLGPVVSQLSVDYLGTREFAMRPRLWLSIMSRNGTTVSISPPFGYALCARRLREGDAAQLDLSAWRVAGVGAEMIRPAWLQRFADALAPAGFRREAFMACYGMAEVSLAVSFSPLGHGVECDRVVSDVMAREARAEVARASTGESRVSEFVNCGRLLPGFELKILDAAGRAVGDRECGVVHLRSASVMAGYAGNPEATSEALSPDGWLNTGDIGYRVGDFLYLTGRAKDMLIINGRNIWPQDLEYLAETQDEVRSEGAAAFSIPGRNGAEAPVLVVQSRESDPLLQAGLIDRIRHLILAELGIHCLVELVPSRTLPRTSSGKLSRSAAKRDFLQRNPEALAGLEVAASLHASEA